MRLYLDLARTVLANGVWTSKPGGVDSINYFGYTCMIALDGGFPLLTTRAINFKAVTAELLWQLSGDPHVNNLRRHTRIWDKWAGQDGHLESAPGRFWRRFPYPAFSEKAGGEMWSQTGTDHVHTSKRWLEFDQLAWVVSNLRQRANSRKHVIVAWHPGNATVSNVPPCIVALIWNVKGQRLNLHVTQRSADIAVGLPFDIAELALLTLILARETSLQPGMMMYSITDAHVYCGRHSSRSSPRTTAKLHEALRVFLQRDRSSEQEVADLGANELGGDPGDEYNHIPGLLRQLSREPRQLPVVRISARPMERLEPGDIVLEGYHPHPRIPFSVVP